MVPLLLIDDDNGKICGAEIEGKSMQRKGKNKRISDDHQLTCVCNLLNVGQSCG